MLKIKLTILLAMTLLITTGCSISFGGGVDNSRTGGIFKSEDFGQTWTQKVLVPTVTGAPKSIAAFDSLDIAVDPSDPRAIYLGTYNWGLYYSYSGGEEWNFIPASAQRSVASVAVDPKEKCRIYYVSFAKVFKTEDCGRTWSTVYNDNNPNILSYSLIIDFYTPARLFLSNSRGDIMKSEDYGNTWVRLVNIKEPIRRLVMSPSDSRIIFAATVGDGLYRTMDGGATWQELAPRMKAFKDIKKFKALSPSAAQAGVWLYATENNIYRTVNNGDDWVALKLVTPERNAIINSVAISHQDVKKIYYVTNTTFYSSFDGGETWKTRKLPTPRRGILLVPDTNQDGVLYLGTRVQDTQ